MLYHLVGETLIAWWLNPYLLLVKPTYIYIFIYCWLYLPEMLLNAQELRSWPKASMCRGQAAFWQKFGFLDKEKNWG